MLEVHKDLTSSRGSGPGRSPHHEERGNSALHEVLPPTTLDIEDGLAIVEGTTEYDLHHTRASRATSSQARKKASRFATAFGKASGARVGRAGIVVLDPAAEPAVHQAPREAIVR